MIVEADVTFVDGALYSNDFHDRYASADALSECERVHIAPAQLIERARRADLFTVFEFGFGAGINFLSIAQHHLKRGSNTRLRFVSCELHPLAWSDLNRALIPYRDQFPLIDDFLQTYPPRLPGIHRRLFANDKVELTIYYTDVAQALGDFLVRDQQGVDAWILDGFAPDRNPRMWDPEMLGQLAARTNEGGTLSSFSSAGSVRRALAASGFEVKRVENSPLKRHTTLARIKDSKFKPRGHPKSVHVFGGGFAGSATAHALARRGVKVELSTLSGQVADQTSAIPVAIMHGRLSVDPTPAMMFRAHAYFYSCCLEHRKRAIDHGVLQLPSRHMNERRLEALCEHLGDRWIRSLTPSEVSELANVAVKSNGYFFPRSCVMNGHSLCDSFMDDVQVPVKRSNIEDAPHGEADLVVATRSNQPVRKVTDYLEIANLDGQIDVFQTFTPNRCMKKTVVRDGYCVPTTNSFVAGSTYEYQPWTEGRSTAVNRNRLTDLVPEVEFDHVRSFRAARAVTSDRVPVVGRTSDLLWLNLGHGSSGTTTAPFAGELLASLICAEVPPALPEVEETVSPTRFLERQKRRPNPFVSSNRI